MIAARLIGLLRGATTLAVWTAVGAAVALALVTSFPGLAGYRSFTVLTGSMEPSLGVGSIVFTEPISPLEAKPGEILTFPDPMDHSRMTTHRLKRLELRGAKAFIVTKGDANDTAERWNVPVQDELGRVVVQAPKLGYVRAWLSDRTGRLAAVALVVLWGALAMREIWRRPQPVQRTARPATPWTTVGEGAGR